MALSNRKPISTANALTRLRDLCDRGEYCTSELYTKLKNWGISFGDAEKIVATLQIGRYVDDLRFARAFAHTKAMNSHWGKLKIKLHLINRKLPSDYISTALDEIDEDQYMEALKQVLGTKKRQLGEEADSYEGRTKLYRHAVGRGYETSLVSQIIKSRDY